MAVWLPDPAWRLGLFGLLLLPVVMALDGLIFPSGWPIAFAVHMAGVAIVVWGMATAYPHGHAGACNLVTMLRLALVAVLAAGVGVAGPMETGTVWAIFALAVLALSLDGVDGWLARRAGLSSDFGARFDMETDAALAAVLAALLMAEGRVGPEILILGLTRYVYVAASLVWPWLASPLYPSLRRKTVCVIQIGTLAVLTLPVLPDGFARPLAVTASVLLVWSFVRDIRWLAARR
ncbi:Phosphatidylglycerophosphate synthase [Loktanella fryxellensis]|uniref:Phosphatidylglycerophosphate synthase n=2 Tax=Loktanella fryxellensis TaxID=245187 RepID=A0A1H8GQK1_9RHOB|nr:Phosphatidylglycerophosphate synthase [Loktanella fryxellensis]